MESAIGMTSSGLVTTVLNAAQIWFMQNRVTSEVMDFLNPFVYSLSFVHAVYIKYGGSCSSHGILLR